MRPLPWLCSPGVRDGGGATAPQEGGGGEQPRAHGAGQPTRQNDTSHCSKAGQGAVCMCMLGMLALQALACGGQILCRLVCLQHYLSLCGFVCTLFIPVPSSIHSPAFSILLAALSAGQGCRGLLPHQGPGGRRAQEDPQGCGAPDTRLRETVCACEEPAQQVCQPDPGEVECSLLQVSSVCLQRRPAGCKLSNA